MPLFTYLRILQGSVIQLPEDCSVYHAAADPVVLPVTNFSMISKASVLLEHIHSPLYHLPLTDPQLQTRLMSRLCTKEMTQGKGNQNKTSCEVYGP